MDLYFWNREFKHISSTVYDREYGIRESDWIELIKHAPNLKHFFIDSMTSADIAHALIQNCKKLATITMHRCRDLQLFEQFCALNNLESIRLVHYTMENAELCRQWIGRQTKLRDLSIILGASFILPHELYQMLQQSKSTLESICIFPDTTSEPIDIDLIAPNATNIADSSMIMPAVKYLISVIHPIQSGLYAFHFPNLLRFLMVIAFDYDLEYFTKWFELHPSVQECVLAMIATSVDGFTKLVPRLVKLKKVHYYTFVYLLKY